MVVHLFLNNNKDLDFLPINSIKNGGVTDGGISKTINLHNSATKEDIAYAILLAKEKGCVGISLYRNGSLTAQPTQMANQ